METLISVIIPTYNRFSLLRAAIDSVRAQTYKNIEIIVVNDASTDADYYRGAPPAGVTMIHLPKNTREMFGFPCAGYVRNQGARIARGSYLAFLDDDDVWLPCKLEEQMRAICESGTQISCTDGYIGNCAWDYLLGTFPTQGIDGVHDFLKLYNKEHYFDTLCRIYDHAAISTATSIDPDGSAPQARRYNLRRDGFPRLWCADFLKIHNCVITSSVLISRNIFDELRGFRELRNGEEDYDLWRRATDECGWQFVYVDKPCFYYFIRGS